MWRGPRGVLRLLAVVVVAGVAGLAALVGVASVSGRPPVFLGAGLAVFLAATAAGVALVTRRVPGGRRRRARLGGFAAGALVGVAAFVVTALLPVGDPRLPPAPVPGQRWWELPTGSRIAWVRLAAQGPRRPTPVVFLHGGPGIADMAGDAATSGSSPATATTSGSTTRSAPAARPGSGTLGSTPSPATSPTWRPSASASAPTGWC
jgi:proline iminopeptidase